MKKSLRKSGYKLKIINDGSSFLHNEHCWKGWIPLTNKDMSFHPTWKNTFSLTTKLEKSKSHITDYTKKFNKKPK